ncbi:MAG: MBL fold metallo-hydrolase [Rhodothermales bacterium]|nr:MBL fold metallo-hydrolase [Rhodothermales bacterium]
MLAYLYEERLLDTRFDLRGNRGGAALSAKFLNSGHILGSAGVSLSFRENGSDKSFFFTSDTNVNHQTIIPGATYPDRVDNLMIETTAGADPDAELYTRRSEELRLGEAIEQTLRRGGAVLIPVFALGRAQEVLALIQRYKDRGVIPHDTPLYTAGSMRAVAGLYDRTRESTPRLNPEFEVEQVAQLRVPRSRSRMQESVDEPSIHVVASGMLFERTLSNLLATMIVGDERNSVFFVGYAREDSPGGILLEAERGDRAILSSEIGEQTINCNVDRFRLSGHSHRMELVELVGRLNPTNVVLVHGETEAQSWMREAIESRYRDVTVIVPECGKEIIL